MVGVISWMLHRHLVSGRPQLTTKARFLRLIYTDTVGTAAWVTFELPNNKKLELKFKNFNITLKRGDIVKVTYQGVRGISAKKIPPSPPPLEPQFSKPQTLQSTQRKQPPSARKTTTPQSRNTPSYNNPTRK